jgi:hypothetical protein
MLSPFLNLISGYLSIIIYAALLLLLMSFVVIFRNIIAEFFFKITMKKFCKHNGDLGSLAKYDLKTLENYIDKRNKWKAFYEFVKNKDLP